MLEKRAGGCLGPMHVAHTHTYRHPSVIARAVAVPKRLVRGCLLHDFKVGLSAEYFKSFWIMPFMNAWPGIGSSSSVCQIYSFFNEPRSEQPQVLDDETLKATIEDKRQNLCELT